MPPTSHQCDMFCRAWQCLVMFGLIGGCRLQAIDEYERQLDWTLDSDSAVS